MLCDTGTARGYCYKKKAGRMPGLLVSINWPPVLREHLEAIEPCRSGQRHNHLGRIAAANKLECVRGIVDPCRRAEGWRDHQIRARRGRPRELEVAANANGSQGNRRHGHYEVRDHLRGSHAPVGAREADIRVAASHRGRDVHDDIRHERGGADQVFEGRSEGRPIVIEAYLDWICVSPEINGCNRNEGTRASSRESSVGQVPDAPGIAGKDVHTQGHTGCYAAVTQGAAAATYCPRPCGSVLDTEGHTVRLATRSSYELIDEGDVEGRDTLLGQQEG